MKIYTKTGDRGVTRLFSGESVPKDEARMEALGSIDELVSALGVAKAELVPGAMADLLTVLQKDLYVMLSEIGTGERKVAQLPVLLETDNLEALEAHIDRLQRELPELREFIFPGQSRASAALHMARTTCRRAERRIVTVADSFPVRPVITAYLNRMSDLLFVAARHVDHQAGLGDRTFKDAT